MFVGSYLIIYEFESWITGVCSPHVVSLVILNTMWSCKSLKLICILPFGILCLSVIRMMFVNSLRCYTCSLVLWSERKRTLVFSVNCVQSAFL